MYYVIGTIALTLLFLYFLTRDPYRGHHQCLNCGVFWVGSGCICPGCGCISKHCDPDPYALCRMCCECGTRYHSCDHSYCPSCRCSTAFIEECGSAC